MKNTKSMIILYGIITILNGICGILYAYCGRWIIGSIWILAAIIWGINFNSTINDYIHSKSTFYK